MRPKVASELGEEVLEKPRPEAILDRHAVSQADQATGPSPKNPAPRACLFPLAQGKGHSSPCSIVSLLGARHVVQGRGWGGSGGRRGHRRGSNSVPETEDGRHEARWGSGEQPMFLGLQDLTAAFVWGKQGGGVLWKCTRSGVN